ncbi:hypothetical protein BGZ60DRAFT_517799 [Tricladium varicosporioides]|nr:hypothetical protein BGZ60DRAFT_517799 [Hymenoscyphus varicosporioides]
MALADIAEQYFAFEARLQSFHEAQQASKRRASNASARGPKVVKWPHKHMSTEEFAKAGFFYHPLPGNPDNVACFLCHKNIDGWQEGDDPIAEHLKYSADCGWAIVATIERQDGVLSEEYPSSKKMIEARKATFAGRWPYEGKKGWKCKTKQMVDAGWKYTPTADADDMATCAYCSLALDGWEPKDIPLDEHFKRSPECPFFVLINNHIKSPAVKRTKSKRASKASRLSTQSSLTIASDVASVADLPAEEEDSILTTATNATAKKMGKAKKAPAKPRKTRAKQAEPVEVVPKPEPEDNDFEVKINPAPKPTRGRKRKSEDHDITATIEISVPPPKRRATRTGGSVLEDSGFVVDESTQGISNPKSRKGRTSTRPSRKASTASAAPLRAHTPDDDAIDAALEADLERHLTDEEEQPQISNTIFKKSIRAGKGNSSDHAMFGVKPIDTDEAAIEAELEAMEVDSKPLPKAKGAKGKQPRKVSAKQQAAARKAEAEAQRIAGEEASQQIALELEHSISVQDSSPIPQPKRQRASSRQPARKAPGRATRGSVLSTNGRGLSNTQNNHESKVDHKMIDSGNETDASMASQSTVVRSGSTHRGSTMKKGKGKGGKKVVSRNVEEILHPARVQAQSIEPEEPITSATKGKILPCAEETDIVEEAYYTPTPEAETLEAPKASKPRGRLLKATQVESHELPQISVASGPSHLRGNSTKGRVVFQETRSPTPPPKETTPSQSPQSSNAENHPPSSKPSAATKKTTTPHSVRRVPLATMTPTMSPSKRNIVAGLQTLYPWSGVDLDTVFTRSPSGCNVITNIQGLLGDDMTKNGMLTSPEKRMTVEEWIQHNAEVAEEKLRTDCERMVSTFESEGTRAMRALEGIECLE